jgi:tRNA(Ile)-lysidine synthase
LRPDSAAEALAVAELCGRLGVPHAVLSWEGAKPARSIQAEARRARYALLAGEARRLDCAVIVTAHTLDDQAETMLMRLAHGSGPAGLAGMRERAETGGVPLLRPLLRLPKARLVATAEARRLPFVRDPSNADPRFERVRWRRMAPLLAEAGLTAERLGRLAERMARLEAAARQRAQEAFAATRRPDALGGGIRLDFSALLAEPEEIVLRVTGLALDAVGAAAGGYDRLERLEDCVQALCAAAKTGFAIRRTLSGCIVSLGRDGVLLLEREGQRRRGVHPATS